MKRYDFTRFRAWQAFKVHVAFEKYLFLIFAILFLKFFNFVITYWYVMIPLLLIGLVKLLSVAAEEEKQQNFRQQKLDVLSERVNKITRTPLSNYYTASKETYDELIKEIETLLFKINSDNDYQALRWHIDELERRLKLFKEFRG